MTSIQRQGASPAAVAQNGQSSRTGRRQPPAVISQPEDGPRRSSSKPPPCNARGRRARSRRKRGSGS
ncbi:hypothetical protein MMSR116_11490 [Methylobacterium mesophilicum SR1.6/6]|uniref:Uncharacterized protein n=1 Tax=Methylobacterium mesophilicum SR1.6/6 TaxID=908290 RepID=A0A6B9FMV9_9HYPH|nr:hypothetical protein MMSR116_11490 [Methylobacterium mesophilicum SR1.6/6]